MTKAYCNINVRFSLIVELLLCFKFSIYNEFTKILLLSETYRRPIRDLSETHRRPLGDLLETDMPDWRPIGDRLACGV